MACLGKNRNIYTPRILQEQNLLKKNINTYRKTPKAEKYEINFEVKEITLKVILEDRINSSQNHKHSLHLKSTKKTSELKQNKK